MSLSVDDIAAISSRVVRALNRLTCCYRLQSTSISSILAELCFSVLYSPAEVSIAHRRRLGVTADSRPTYRPTDKRRHRRVRRELSTCIYTQWPTVTGYITLQWGRSLARTASRCPKGLYFTAVVFFLFWRLISEVFERISTKLGHTFTYDCYLKNVVRTLPGRGKSRFLGPTLTFDRTCNGTYQQSGRNLSIYRDFPTCPQIWWTLAQKRPRTVGEFLSKFSHWDNIIWQTAGMLCSGTSLQSTTTECLAGSRWALPCI